MSGIRISELPRLTEITVDDYVVVNDANIHTKSIRFSDFVSSINDVGGLIVTTKDVRLAATAVEEQTALNRLREVSSPIFNQSEANILIAVALHDLNMRVSDFESIDVTEFRDTLIEYKDKTDILENQVNNINSQIDTHGNQIIDINNQLTNQGQQITDISNEITQIVDDDLTARVASLESKTEFFEPSIYGDSSEDDPKTIIDSSLLLQDPRSQYAIEFLDFNDDRPAGSFIVRNYNASTRGQLFDDIIVEQYWDPNVSKYKFHVAGPNEPEEGVSMQMDEEVLEIFVDTNIKGGLLVNDVDVLQQIGVVKTLVIAEVTGLSLALKTKFNKEGGDIFGPVNVKPTGLTGLTLFSVDDDGPQSAVAPTRPFSLTNKKYVDEQINSAGKVQSVAGKEGEVILVKADIVDFEDSDYATAAQGQKADTALQPNDNVSELVNDAGYLVQSDLDGLSNALVFKGNIDATTDYPVSVSTGDVWANTTAGTADVQWTGLTNVTSGDLIAKGENQWVVVGSSTVPDLSGYVEYGDNVSDLVNDAGYITEAQATSAAPVQSVAGKTGGVTLVKADITDLVESDYATSTQGDKADTALQSGDNVSELSNDAGYVTKTYSDDEDDKIKDLVGDTLAEINVQLGKYDYAFNYKVVELFSAEEGEMTANSADPAINTMFVLDKIQTDGTSADFLSVAQDLDVLIIEQNIGQRLRYEVIQVIDIGDQFAINCDFLDTDGTGATEFFFNRQATVYIEKANSDKSDFVTEEFVNTSFLKLTGGSLTGKLDVAVASGDALRVLGDFQIKKSGQSIGGLNLLSSYNDTISYNGDINNSTHITNKGYVDSYSMPKDLSTLPLLTR